MSVFTEQEQEKIRYHLGYMATSFGGQQTAASLSFGIPISRPTTFLLEEAIQRLLTNTYAANRVRSILNTMDSLEAQIKAAACTLAAKKIGELELRDATAGETHPDLLEREYVRWGLRLAGILGVPAYPYSDRYAKYGRSGGIYNIKVG